MVFMADSIQSERRREDRHPQNIEAAVQELPDSESAAPYPPRSMSGRILNMSRNGVCLFTPSPIRLLSVIRCEIPVNESDIPVATLMRVRWTRKQEQNGGGYLSGLETIL